MSDEFTNPVCAPWSLDAFGPRRSILAALTREAPNFTGTFLDVGCGRMPYRAMLTAPGRIRKYIGLDLGRDTYGQPDLLWDGAIIPLADDSVDSAMATEVLEHCPHPDALVAEVQRVLRPGGLFFLTVPFLWPLHDAPYDEYRYTPFAIERLLRDGGFDDVSAYALGGWDASLAQMLGLWISRRPMPARIRRLLSVAMTPVIRALFERETLPVEPRDQLMITGVAARATKRPGTKGTK
jgi:SAM-dependent methyltransferase